MKISHLLQPLAVICTATGAFARVGGAEKPEDGARELINIGSGTGLVGTTVQLSLYHTYEVFHKLSALCWDGGNADAKSIYTGIKCGTDNAQMQWEKIETVDASGNVVTCSNGHLASWKREDYDAHWQEVWLGGCGTTPLVTSVPTTATSTGYEDLTAVTRTTQHDLSSICYSSSLAGGNPTMNVKYYGTSCPSDSSKIVWNRMETLDSNNNIVSCNGQKAVFNRGFHGAGWDTVWMGSCGTAPLEVKRLPTLTPYLTVDFVGDGDCADSAGNGYNDLFFWDPPAHYDRWDMVNLCRNHADHVENGFVGVHWMDYALGSYNVFTCLYEHGTNPKTYRGGSVYDGTGAVAGVRPGTTGKCYKAY